MGSGLLVKMDLEKSKQLVVNNVTDMFNQNTT